MLLARALVPEPGAPVLGMVEYGAVLAELALIGFVIFGFGVLAYEHEVHDLTVEGSSVERELAMLKVVGDGDKRVEALRLADIFRANVVDSTLGSFVFEITGAPEKIDAFADLMRPLGLAEVARTGVAALLRGE